MILREELERVMGAFLIGNRRSAPRQDLEYYVRVANDFLRDHGQALLEVVRLVESVPRKQTVDDYGSGSDEQNMDLDDMMHMRGWNDCIDEIDLARSKTVDGGGA